MYLKDSDKIIDIEMQSKTFSSLGKRTRYYQSMIDIDALMKGEDYPHLKESYILFICKNDPFKQDDTSSLPCYTFRNICLENSLVNLNDKAVKVIYNSSAYEKAEDPKIRDFLHFIYTDDPGEDDFTNRISAMVKKLKDNEKFRRDYAAMNLHDFDITQEAKKEATQQKAIKDAINLLKMNIITPEQIAQAVGLSLKEVLSLKEEITIKA